MLSSVLSNVPLGTADLLALILLAVIFSFLVTGALVSYFYWRRVKTAPAPDPATAA
jgi:hypothetical protein